MSSESNLFRKIHNACSSLHIGHWFVIFLSLGLTLFAWWYSKDLVASKVELQFERQCNQVVRLVIERMQKYEDALWGGVANIHSANNAITNSSWKVYVDSLNIVKKYPGINGMGVIFSVHPQQLQDFLREQRQVRPNFYIHPSHNQPRFLPITYIIPEKENEKAVGLDMVFEKNRYSAALKAEKTGKAQLTAPIVLVQDKQKTPGFLLFAPYYSKQNLSKTTDRIANFQGMVYAPFIMRNLIDGTLDQRNRDVAIKISDGHYVLYDEFKQNNLHYDANADYKKEISIRLYGRDWTFNISSSNSFSTANYNNQPNAILVGGIIIDLLLIFLFVQISGSKQRAEKHAEVLTQNINKQGKAHAKLNRRLELALTASQIGVWDYDIQTQELIWDDAMFIIFGVNKEQFSGSYDAWESTLHPDDKIEAVKKFEMAIAKRSKLDMHFRIILPCKAIRVIQSLADVIIENEQPSKMVGVNWDITDIKNKESQLERFANYDALSQLKNRFNFNESCSQIIKSSKKLNRKFALLLIDIDDFKQINDLYGHQAGDKFISKLSEKLKTTCRERDSIFRLGGDEFAILSVFKDNEAVALDIADRIISAFDDPFVIEGSKIKCSCSIGIAVFPNAGSTPDELMTNADIALYKSKAEGKDCINYFTDTLNQKAKRLRFIKNNIVTCAKNGEFYMKYQPIIDAKKGKTIAVEALARWESSLGLIPPDEFISVSEKNNTINVLGQVIVETVAEDIRNHPYELKVSINCSSKQLTENSGFSEHLFKTLESASIKPKNVILEITETYLIRDHKEISESLDEIHHKGIDIAIDDFGTGYSSLSLLANIPFQYLKIDREFINNINSPKGFKVLQCIYNVACSLDKHIIAEGVETKEQLDKLMSMGIHLIQGYYFSKPVDISELTSAGNQK